MISLILLVDLYDDYLISLNHLRLILGIIMMNNYSAETEMLNRIITYFKDEKFYEAFKNNSQFTEFISELVDKIAKDMGLQHYREYYTLDHVLYDKDDAIPEGLLRFGTSSVHGTWLTHICVAIEHENYLDACGGYQELAKLMLFNADMKILVGYANKGDNYDAYAQDYQLLFSKSSTSSSTPILLIGEYGDAHVDAYLITPNGLLKHNSEDETWFPIELSV